MNKSELRKIIKEEISITLKEDIIPKGDGISFSTKRDRINKLIQEEIKSTLKEDDFGVGVDFNPGSERNPSNKMIYDLLGEIKLMVNRVLENTHKQYTPK